MSMSDDILSKPVISYGNSNEDEEEKDRVL